MNEKQERFLRIAERRTNKILKMIRLLSNCANRSVYAYEDAQVKKIFGAIEEELREVRAKFASKDKKDFSLD